MGELIVKNRFVSAARSMVVQRLVLSGGIYTSAAPATFQNVDWFVACSLIRPCKHPCARRTPCLPHSAQK